MRSMRRHLHERGEQLRHVALVRLQVLLQEGVEVEQQQAVHAHDAADERHDRQARFKLLAAAAALQPREQALRKALRFL